MISEPIRLGLIGAGLFARDTIVPVLNTLTADFQVAAVYSRTTESARKLVDLLPAPADVYTDRAQLLARDDIDAVYVVLPIHLLPEAVEAALAAGKHVISEKPIAPTVVAGRDLLVAYAAHQDRVWMVAENYRYEDPFVKAAALIAAGRIGRPLLADWAIHVPFLPDNKYYQTVWRRNEAFPGGMLLDGGVHHVAGWRLVLGEIAAVNAIGAQQRADLPPLDTLSANFHFASGTIGSYSVTYAAGAPWYGNLQIVGVEGALVVARGEPLQLTVNGATELIPVEPFMGVRDEFAAFAGAIRTGAAHRNPPEEALRDVAVVEAMLQSAVKGRTITPAQI
jgi:predicted dehydrogenase